MLGVNDDVPGLPLPDFIGVKGQAFGIAVKENPQVFDPPEIDVGVGNVDFRVGFPVGGDV